MEIALSPDRWATYYHAQAHRRGSLMPRHLSIAAALLLATSLPQAHAAEGWRYGISADAMVDDNVTRGLYDADVESDSILSVEGSAVRSVLLGPRSGVVFRAAARYSQFVTFSDLSNLALSGRAAWRTQPGLNFSSPIFEVAGNLAWLQHADSELRDGTIVTIEGSVGSHVTDRVRLGAGMAWDTRNGGDPGRPGEVAIYDMDNTRFWASLDYRFGARNTAYARLTQVSGDQVFNSVTVGGLSGAWATDPAFAEELGRPTDSYRVDASTLIYEIGVNLPLAGAHVLDFLLSGYSAKAEEGPQSGNKYSGTVVRATYFYRFH
jgi:hypothetical protein